MALVALVPHQQYSPDDFMKAVESDRKKFQPGAVLEIITEEQRINNGDQQQKVTFVFQRWCVQCCPKGECIVDMGGERLVGESLMGHLRMVGRKWKELKAPTRDI